MDSSFVDELKNKFWKDLQGISTSLIKVFKLQYDAKVENPIDRWISFVTRLIEPKERFTYFSKGFWERVPKNYFPEIHFLADKFEYGEDVNIFQSSTLLSNSPAEKKGRRTDLLLADWGIHHFHLVTSNEIRKNGLSHRSEYLLFAYVGDDFACFLDVKPHKPDPFADPSLIKQIVESWPELAEMRKLKGVLPGKELTEKEITLLRKSGCMVPAIVNNNIYMIGGGITSAGTSLKDVQNRDKIFFDIERLSKGIAEYLKKRNIQVDARSYSIKFDGNDLILHSSVDQSQKIIQDSQFKQINRFFNQTWLTEKYFKNLGAL